MREHERRALQLLDDAGHRHRLAGAGRAEQRREAIAARHGGRDLPDRLGLIGGRREDVLELELRHGWRSTIAAVAASLWPQPPAAGSRLAPLGCHRPRTRSRSRGPASRRGILRTWRRDSPPRASCARPPGASRGRRPIAAEPVERRPARPGRVRPRRHASVLRTTPPFARTPRQARPPRRAVAARPATGRTASAPAHAARRSSATPRAQSRASGGSKARRAAA